MEAPSAGFEPALLTASDAVAVSRAMLARVDGAGDPDAARNVRGGIVGERARCEHLRFEGVIGVGGGLAAGPATEQQNQRQKRMLDATLCHVQVLTCWQT